MQPLFSTAGIHPRNAFRRWQEMISENLSSSKVQALGAAPFVGEIAAAHVGPLSFLHAMHSATRTDVTHDDVRRNRRDDRLFAVFTLSGQQTVQQNDREAVMRAGDLVVLDRRPIVSATDAGSFLVMDLPGDRLERALGPTRSFTTLAVGADLASARLASTYVRELVRVRRQLSPDAAARMGGIGVDLIVASLAERLAQDVPRSMHGDILVQRAKAYVEAHLGDPNLDPPRLAAGVGVSLRRLQALFHERGQHISDWIWQRRLAAAAERLADPACLHLPIGTLAYGCGFTSQAHFARRFRNRHGLSPRAFRDAAASGRIEASSKM